MFLLFIPGSNLGGGGPLRGYRGEEEGGSVRSGPGAARTILFFISLLLGPLNSLAWWELYLGYIALG